MMTAEEHITLYNIGMELTCIEPLGNHFCPKKRNYDFFSYWTEVLTESIKTDEFISFGSTVSGKKIELNSVTGEEQVSLSETTDICRDYTTEELVKMVWKPPYGVKKCSNIIRKLDTYNELAGYIECVALEKTLVYFEKVEDWTIPMIEFVDCFDEAVFMSHFRTLSYHLLQKISSGESATKIIEAMTQLLHNCEFIFNNRKDVIVQVKGFITLIKLGIEKKLGQKTDLIYSMSKNMDRLEKKLAAPNCLLFLFLEEDSRNRFCSCIGSLITYLNTYLCSDASPLLNYLENLHDMRWEVENSYMTEQLFWDLQDGKEKNAEKIMESLSDELVYPEGEILSPI